MNQLHSLESAFSLNSLQASNILLSHNLKGLSNYFQLCSQQHYSAMQSIHHYLLSRQHMPCLQHQINLQTYVNYNHFQLDLKQQDSPSQQYILFKQNQQQEKGQRLWLIDDYNPSQPIQQIFQNHLYLATTSYNNYQLAFEQAQFQKDYCLQRQLMGRLGAQLRMCSQRQYMCQRANRANQDNIMLDLFDSMVKKEVKNKRFNINI